ncbi:MAG TPA: hypothetical protein VFN35_29045 [Ktedonobacteraceae bacterium]|nr:hypothetical protein [Ktedonobacteraceae bacterium]
MSSLSFQECCHLFAIDPKTLRQWLAQAHLSLQTHPKDARMKCLNDEQIHLLARLHGVLLASHDSPFLPSEPEQTPNADLHLRLTQLEAQVVTLQTQLADLALQLLQEREQRTEQRLQRLEARHPLTALVSFSAKADEMPFERTVFPSIGSPSKKGKQLVSLIEYGAGGQYVLISPEQGERSFAPESPEWFAWLDPLFSFRFVGQQGRLSAYRKRKRLCWMAYRRIHGHIYSYTLGRTEDLTIERLEHMARTLQRHVPSF